MVQKSQRSGVLLSVGGPLGLKLWRSQDVPIMQRTKLRSRRYVRESRGPKQKMCHNCGHRTVFLYDHGEGMYLCSECEVK